MTCLVGGGPGHEPRHRASRTGQGSKVTGYLAPSQVEDHRSPDGKGSDTGPGSLFTGDQWLVRGHRLLGTGPGSTATRDRTPVAADRLRSGVTCA